MHDLNAASPDVAVVGGGVIGLAVGWRAARRGMRVTVLERAELGGGTSRVAAGMLAPIAEADPGQQPLLRLGVASARVYPDFVAELSEASGHDPGYLACGTLMAARDRDAAQALERELEMRLGLGLAVQRLRASEARRLEPALAPTLRLALEMPNDHAVDPRGLTTALADAIRREGGHLRAGSEVSEIIISGCRVRGLRIRGGEQVSAEQVVICAGVWSGQLSGIPAGALVPIHPVKGQILRLHDPAGPGLLTRVLRMERGYVVPRGDGRYVLGATMEERGFDTTVTAGAMFGLLRDAIELLPGLAELAIDELSAGLRPAAPDNAPVIGPGTIAGLHWATGHYRHGILLTPVTAEMVASALAGENAALPVAGLVEEDRAPFSPTRFAGVPAGA